MPARPCWLRLRTPGPNAANAHIWPKERQIWGTLVRGIETSPGKAHLQCYVKNVPSIERDVRLIVLAASAGSADGWSFFGLGHAFVANMTGNTVLLGLAVFQNHGDLLHPFTALSGYAMGVIAGSLLSRKIPPGAVWTKTISQTLLLEG